MVPTQCHRLGQTSGSGLGRPLHRHGRRLAEQRVDLRWRGIPARLLPGEDHDWKDERCACERYGPFASGVSCELTSTA